MKTLRFLNLVPLNSNLYKLYRRRKLMMHKKHWLMLLSFVIIINCGEKTKQTVLWSPTEPKSNETITITYNSQAEEAKLVNVSQIDVICQFYSEHSDSVLIIPLNKSKKSWQIELHPPEQSYLLSFKFEDSLNRTDDNNGRGWAIIIRDNEGNIAKNTHYHLGQIYRGIVRPEAFPYYKKAIEEFNEEIKVHPQNYMAWFDKWESKAILIKNIKPLIRKKLDSLLAIDPNNLELLKLAYNTNWRILQNNSKAIYFAEQLINATPKPKNIDEIVYTSIFLKYGENFQQQISALEKFVADYPQSKLVESIYYRLGNYYLQLRKNEKALLMFKKLNQLAPEDVANSLTLASMEINNKNYLQAKQLLVNTKSYCTKDIIKRKYPWAHPGKRLNQLNFNLCQIYSTTASLNYTTKDFDEVIKNRTTVIELGTPFPAFEWVGIGNAYVELGNIDEAKRAYIKALCINPNQKKAIQKLNEFYSNENNSETGFIEYLESAISDELKASAKLAPDFEAFDLEDNKLKLSDMKGKIVVLNFWDSWSTACIKEIPQLNELVADFRDSDVVKFWAISIEHKSAINKLLETTTFEYQQLYNGSDVKKLYKIIGLPTHIVIDSNGLLRYKYFGFIPNIKQKLGENVKFLLEESKIVS